MSHEKQLPGPTAEEVLRRSIRMMLSSSSSADEATAAELMSSLVHRDQQRRPVVPSLSVNGDFVVMRVSSSSRERESDLVLHVALGIAFLAKQRCRDSSPTPTTSTTEKKLKQIQDAAARVGIQASLCSLVLPSSDKKIMANNRHEDDVGATTTTHSAPSKWMHSPCARRCIVSAAEMRRLMMEGVVPSLRTLGVTPLSSPPPPQPPRAPARPSEPVQPQHHTARSPIAPQSVQPVQRPQPAPAPAESAQSAEPAQPPPMQSARQSASPPPAVVERKRTTPEVPSQPAQSSPKTPSRRIKVNISSRAEKQGTTTDDDNKRRRQEAQEEDDDVIASEQKKMKRAAMSIQTAVFDASQVELPPSHDDERSEEMPAPASPELYQPERSPQPQRPDRRRDVTPTQKSTTPPKGLATLLPPPPRDEEDELLDYGESEDRGSEPMEQRDTEDEDGGATPRQE